ncbi:MAG: DUF4292 domain-containing protein [Ignavibacteriae bacterium]|nr:DUF4292 domain-containing protein [Ignavibacteriota bacterium]
MNTKETPPDSLLSRVREQGAKLSSLVGNGTVTFDSPEMAGTASFESNMKKPDSLLVVIEGPFGIDLGTLFMTREKFVMYNSMENTVMTADPNSRAVRAVLPFDLSYDQIQNLFAGIFSAPGAENEVNDYRVEDDEFVLTSACGRNVCTYWIDPLYLLVTRYEMRNEQNELTVVASSSSYIEQEGIAAARRISLKFPQQRRQISIVYHSLSLNSPDTDFEFTIPPSARRIDR